MSRVDTNPFCKSLWRAVAGRILNRFSSDSSTVDDSLPFILNILLANVFSALGILAVLLWTQALLLLPCIPLFFLYCYLARYYQVSLSQPHQRLLLELL